MKKISFGLLSLFATPVLAQQAPADVKLTVCQQMLTERENEIMATVEADQTKLGAAQVKITELQKELDVLKKK